MKLLSGAAGVVLVLSSVACAASRPRTPRVQRVPVPLTASFDQTWEAVLGVFDEMDIKVNVRDRKNGSIISDAMQLFGTDTSYADCGKVGQPQRILEPSVARYTAEVRGDSAASTLKVTVSYMGVAGQLVQECVSKGRFESKFEADVRNRAEQSTSAAPSSND